MKKKMFSMLMLTTLLLSFAAMSVGAQTPDTSNPSHLLVLGDSIATGYGLADGQNNYGNQLAQAFNLTGTAYTNLAVDGASSSDLLTALTTNTPETLAPAVTSADTIVLSIGGNDVLGPFISDLKTALDLQSTSTNAQLEAAINANPTAAKTAITTAMGNPQVQAQFATAELTFATNYASIISAIRHTNTTARLYVQTIYNPFSGLPRYDTLSADAETIIGSLNTTIENGASTGNYTVLDIHDAFQGKAAQYTNIAQFDVHPNEAGHTAIFSVAYMAITGKVYTAPSSSSKTSTLSSSSVVSSLQTTNPNTGDNSVSVIEVESIIVVLSGAVLAAIRIALKKAVN
jgi:lysophospholipase L1-like esterase